MPTVHLHVGAMKSGTTYVQEVLDRNRDLMRERGVLFPGRRWHDQVLAVEDLVQRRPKGKPATPGAWQRLVDEVNTFDGETVIISMETMAMADDAAVAHAIESLKPHRIRVVVTARDLLRVVPAQWQESTQNGGTHTFERFLTLASTARSRRLPISRILWSAQDFGHILRTWQPAVQGLEDLVLVTVPPSGSDPALLWQRFCGAVGIEPEGVDASSPSNESLGSTSAELMRRINVLAKQRELPFRTRRVLKMRLAKRLLPQRRSEEPALVLPEKFLPWAARTSQWQVREIEAVGPTVIGDLSDLLVDATSGRRAGSGSRREVDAPEPTSDELLAAAVDGLIGLADQIPRRPRRKGDESQT